MLFCDERVKIELQTIRNFNPSFLLQLSLFEKSNRKLYDCELTKQKKRCAVIHILSMAKVQELLTVSEEYRYRFEYENRIISCFRKVKFQDGTKIY